ncbi:MAG: hypothetical protein GWP14_09985 [Actinobacteria bacterium]|nr:hypothetical protein [Actinomycetota bacterium]
MPAHSHHRDQMSSRQRVLTALNHQKPDRTPRLLYGELIGYVPAIQELLKKRCSPKSPREYFSMDITGVVQNPTKLSPERFAEWLPEKAKEARKGAATSQESVGANADEWGVWWRPGSFQHFVHIESPLAGIDNFGRIREYPWPDLDQSYRYEGMAERVAFLHDQDGVAVAGFAGSIFEQAWYIRGMENLLEDMMINPEVAHFMFDHTAYYQKALAVGMAKAGVDIVMLGDDVASQTGMMMSVDTWQEFLGPHLAATIKAVKAIRPEVKIFYHSDGKVSDLIPKLIEVGVEILNPLQPECNDVAEIKQSYGQDLCFFGTISVQQTLPFGSVDDVRREVEDRITKAGHDGGLILCPSHVLGPEVPWENIAAFFEAVDEFH